MESEAPTSLPKEGGHSHHHDFSPLNWEDFFTEKRLVSIGEDRFNVYLKGNSGPVFFLLHGEFILGIFWINVLFLGGGYTGLTWSCFAVSFLELFKSICVNF